MTRLLPVAALLLSACGSTRALEPPAGAAPLPVAYGAETPATTGQLLTPSVQARPQRGDTTLQRSQPRAADDFDLPPD